MALDEYAEAIRERCRQKGIPLGVTRIGVHAGPAIVGNFGGGRFFDYTAYGGTINVAARLEAEGFRVEVQANSTRGEPIPPQVLLIGAAVADKGKPADDKAKDDKAKPADEKGKMVYAKLENDPVVVKVPASEVEPLRKFLEKPEAAAMPVDPEERRRLICSAAESYGMIFPGDDKP